MCEVAVTIFTEGLESFGVILWNFCATNLECYTDRLTG